MSTSSPPLEFWPREPFRGRLETDWVCPSPLWVVRSPWSSKLSSAYHPWYIKFTYTAVEQVQINRDFHAMAGLPNIIGAIDCTHICVKAPMPLWSALLVCWRPGVSIQRGANCSIAQRRHTRLFCCVLHNIAMNEGLPLPESAQVDIMPESDMACSCETFMRKKWEKFRIRIQKCLRTPQIEVIHLWIELDFSPWLSFQVAIPPIHSVNPPENACPLCLPARPLLRRIE